jgi:hypothetical protein
MKLELNEQLQKAVVMYQAVRSNNATTSKDLAEVLKICPTFLESRKETSDETAVGDIVIAGTDRRVWRRRVRSLRGCTVA